MKTLAREADLVEIRRRCEALTEADMRRWGRMSVLEMVCHVREAYRLGMGESPAEFQKIAIPRPLMKWMALRFPRRWPEGVPTVPELQVGGARCMPGRFDEDRAGLLDALGAFAGARDNRNGHPIFGRMGPGDWMRWGYLHADHHLRQFGR